MLTPQASRASSLSPTFGSEEPNLSSRPQKRKRKEKPESEDILRKTLKKVVDEKEDPIDIFTDWIGSELKEIKNCKILKTLKRKIINNIQEAQDEDELI